MLGQYLNPGDVYTDGVVVVTIESVDSRIVRGSMNVGNTKVYIQYSYPTFQDLIRRGAIKRQEPDTCIENHILHH